MKKGIETDLTLQFVCDICRKEFNWLDIKNKKQIKNLCYESLGIKSEVTNIDFWENPFYTVCRGCCTCH